MFIHELQEEKLQELKSECEQLKLSTEKANQAMKTMSIKLKRAEQDPSPSKKHLQELKKLEANCAKLRGQLVEEKSARVRAEESLEKVTALEENTSKEVVEKTQNLSKQIEELKKDKESLHGKLQLSINNSRRLEKDLSTLQSHVSSLESESSNKSSRAKTQGESGESYELQKKLDEKEEEAISLKELAETNEREAEQYLRNYTDLTKRYQKVEALNDTLSSKVKILTSMLKAAKAAKSERPADSSKPALVSQNMPLVKVALPADDPAIKAHLLSNHTNNFHGQSKLSTGALEVAAPPNSSVESTKTPSPGRRRTRLSARRRSSTSKVEIAQSITAPATNTEVTINPDVPMKVESLSSQEKVSVVKVEVENNHVSHLPVRAGKRPLNTPVKPIETKRSRNLSGQEAGQSEQSNAITTEQQNRGKSPNIFHPVCSIF